MKTYANLTWVRISLYYFASLIGLAPVNASNKIFRPVGFLHKTYAVILAILSSFWIYYVFLNHRVQSVKVTFVNQFVFTSMLTLFGGSLWVTLLIFAFKSNKMIDIMNRLTAMKNELKNLGIENSCGRNYKAFYVRIIATNGVVLLMKIIIDYADHHHHPDHGIAFGALYWVGRIMTTIHSHSAVLIFVETMIYISKLFESLNNKLQGTVKANCNFRLFNERQNSSVLGLDRNQRVADQVAHVISTESENIQLSLEDVEKIEKLHKELCDLVESATHFHTVPLLFAIIRNFSNMLSNCYLMFTHVFVSHGVLGTAKNILPWIQQLAARTTITWLELFLIAHASASVSRAGNATKVILHEVWNKYYPEELRDELSKFSLQLLHKPVAVSAFGFFDLGYTCIYKIFCALVAYLIIMIQFDTSQPKSRIYK